MVKIPNRSWNGRKSMAGKVAVACRISIPLLMLLCVLPANSPVSGEALPDFEWRRIFDPVHGAFIKDEPNPVVLSLHLVGKVEEIPISWQIIRGKTVTDSGDTVIVAAKRADDTAFTLRLPPLRPGNYRLDVTTDPENIIEERNEHNNRASYPFFIPNGAPVVFRCEGPDGNSWELYRVELSTASGDPYPDDFGTAADTARSDEYTTVVNGVEPGDYVGVFFGPTVNREPILISYGSFEMPDPPEEIEVVWPRTTPYLVGRPNISGDAPVAVGGETGAPRWRAFDKISLNGTIRNPDDQTADAQWMLRFLDTNGYSTAELDTLISVGAIATTGAYLSGRVPQIVGNFLMQAEVRVFWPIGFEDLGEDPRGASFVLPLGWIEVW